MPKFDGGSDPEAYFTWELKVDKIFRLHNYTEEKKLAMASPVFEGYALIWWEQLLQDREEDGENPIATWAEMKREMRRCFVPKHYWRDLFDKLQNLKQGNYCPPMTQTFYTKAERSGVLSPLEESCLKPAPPRTGGIRSDDTIQRLCVLTCNNSVWTGIGGNTLRRSLVSK
jgi:hypothetical protein